MTPPPRRALRAGLLGAAAAVAVLPDRFRCDHRFPLVDLAAWRPHAAALTLGAAALLGVRRRTRPAGAALGAAGLAGAAAALAARPRPRPAGPVTGGTELTVLSANVLLGRADTGALAALVADERPDLVVLPEAGTDFRDKLLPLLGELGYRGWSSVEDGVDDGHGVVLLASARAGDLQVRAADGMRLRHLEATGGLLGGRTVHAVHTSAPVHRRWTADWNRELELIGRWTRAVPAPVVVGDLNATLDHRPLRAALGGCRSAGGSWSATYPASLPRWAGIGIDHVLVPREARTRRHAVLDLPGTDHRAVLTTVVL